MSLGRGLALWAVLFAAFASTLGTTASDGSDYAGTEPHYLLTAESIVSDGDFDLRDEYAARDHRDFGTDRLRPNGDLVEGHRHEPHGVGFPLLITPAYALGGAKGVELFCAAIAALGFVLAAALARRLVPEPWATAGPLVAGLSLPALAYGAAVYPELVAGTVLAGAALLALRLCDRPTFRTAMATGALLAALPWLGVKYLPAGVVIALALARWLLRRQRGLAALISGEVALTSFIVFVTVSDRLFGGVTSYSAATGEGGITGADSLGEYAERADRLAGLWIDHDAGLLRWAPFFALAFYAVWLLVRSGRERLSDAVSDHVDTEVTAKLLIAICAAQVFVAVFVAPALHGEWFGGRQVVAVLPCAAALCAWGLRHAPRVGFVLAAVTLVASVWFCVELRLADDAGWAAAEESSAPMGPVERVLPRF